jgi:tRNA(Arg) A34 adenosine deaminase TadA
MFPQNTGKMAETPNPKFLERAIALAVENVRGGAGGPFAAVIVKDGAVVAEAANSVTTTHDPTAHGEINAIRKACMALGTFSLAGCAIYSSCEPCPMCLAAIYWARLDALYYGSDCHDAARAGFDDSFLYNELKLDRAARRLPGTQLLQAEAWASFQAWLDCAGKVEY